MNEKITTLENKLAELEKELQLKNRQIEVERALEKVRLKALDMRISAELSQTSIILFQQLKELNIDAIRSGVAIFDDENSAIELWVTSVADNGSLFFVLDYVNIHVHKVFENIIKARDADKDFAVTKLEGKELLDYYKKMSTYVGIPNRTEQLICNYFYSFFFSAGSINVVTVKELTKEEEGIMLRMANVFGLIYTRFLDLKKSEDQAMLISEEKKILQSALDNLKATQTQLIQSEKMASLGQLTAGIAHEIQNPLNFVNNFSEVNQEMAVELKEEIDNGNYAEAKLIANDLIENSEKINHHGKRADAIVKGMLQHSKSNTGIKEPADINKLADEYLRLAYHGLRAKDKSFNAEIKTDFDESIRKINVVPQDIGRVLLNLFNNAFYAVNEKRKLSANSYQPTAEVKTRRINDKVEIIVSDNGNGIPQNLVDKIFQPFFTTKPTGEGTGLGLSLSYDIIKAHGGEIKVKTEENAGSQFVIIL